VLQRENSTLQLLVAIHDRLGALVLQGADAAAITRALTELVDRPILLLDPLLRPVTLDFQSPAEGEVDMPAGLLWDPNEAYVGRVLQTMAGERRSMRLPPLPAWGVNHGCVLAPVVAGDATLGYLAILEPETGSDDAAPAEADLLAAQHAASVYALALMRERLAAEVTTELRDELLEGLLVGHVTDEQATRERARRLGYDESLTYQALVLVPNEGHHGQTFLGSEGWAAGWRRRVLDSVAQLVRDRTAQDETARLDAGHQIDMLVDERQHQPIDRRAQTLRVQEQRRDVAEHDPRLRMVGNRADQGFEINGGAAAHAGKFLLQAALLCRSLERGATRE